MTAVTAARGSGHDTLGMRVLLVNANSSRAVLPAPPIGLAYVATATAGAGHDVRFLDLLLSRKPERELLSALSQSRPDVVGLSIRNIDNVISQRLEGYLDPAIRLTRLIRGNTSARIVIGGPAVTILGTRALELFDADFAVFGEGEDVMPQLLRALEDGESYEDIPGLAWREEDEIRSRPAARRRDFGSSGLEMWIDWRRYERHGATWPIQTKRGCALRCSYCTYPQLEGSEMACRDPEDVAEEIARVSSAVGPRAFELVDSTFSLPARHAAEVCRAIVRRDIGATLSTMGGNPLGITPELLGLMKLAGFNSLMVTPESASETMLRSYRKGFTFAHVEAAAHSVRHSGLASAWFFMLGGPGETEQTVEETMQFIESTLTWRGCLVIIMTGVRILPGSELQKTALSSGYLSAECDLSGPAFYLSPGIEERRVLHRINQAIRCRSNIVHSCEDGGSLLQRASDRALNLLGTAPPFWRFMPRLLGIPPFPFLRSRFPVIGDPAL